MWKRYLLSVMLTRIELAINPNINTLLAGAAVNPEASIARTRQAAGESILLQGGPAPLTVLDELCWSCQITDRRVFAYQYMDDYYIYFELSISNNVETGHFSRLDSLCKIDVEVLATCPISSCLGKQCQFSCTDVMWNSLTSIVQTSKAVLYLRVSLKAETVETLQSCLIQNLCGCSSSATTQSDRKGSSEHTTELSPCEN